MEVIEEKSNYEELSHEPNQNYEGVDYIPEGSQEVYLQPSEVTQGDQEMCFLMTDGTQIFQIPQNAMPLDTKDVFFVVSGSDCNVGEKERHDVYQPPPEQPPADITSISKLLCRKCNILCKSPEEFLNHNVLNHRDLYMCGVCGVGFNKVQRLQNHAVSHATEKPYKCEICEKTFTRKSTLKDHTYLYHQPAAEVAVSCTQCHQKIRPDEEGPHQCSGFKCPHCTRYLKTQPNLDSHVENCHTLPRHQCSCCFKVFTRAAGLKNHMLTHENKRKFQCFSCTFSSNTQAQLKRHEKIHSPEHWYACTKCTRRYATSSGLRNHIIKRHSQAEKEKSLGKEKSYKLRVRKHKKKVRPVRTTTKRRNTKSSQTVRGSEKSTTTQTEDIEILGEVEVESSSPEALDSTVLNSDMLSQRVLSNRLSPVSEEAPADFMAMEGMGYLGRGHII